MRNVHWTVSCIAVSANNFRTIEGSAASIRNGRSMRPESSCFGRAVRNCPALNVASSSVSNVTVQSCQRSEEHTSELQSLMRISYAVFCLKQKQHRTDDCN